MQFNSRSWKVVENRAADSVVIVCGTEVIATLHGDNRLALANKMVEAPALLHALEGVLRVADGPTTNYADETENDELHRLDRFEEARALLARANGEPDED